MVYSEVELMAMAQKEDPGIKLILPKTINDGINCKNYPPGCLSGKTAELKKITVVVVQFDSEENAARAAKIINQYYARNWVFDDVTGEPVLEHFVKKVFDAKNPNNSN